MNEFPTTLSEDVVWLEGSSLSESAKPYFESLVEKNFRVQLGITENDVMQLGTISLQPSIREYCPKDCTDRFKDIPTARRWQQKGRVTFLLKDMNGVIAGYGWSGPGMNEHVPGATLTGALRISEPYQGRGLATPFLAVILAYAHMSWPTSTLWFEAWQSNASAFHIYKKLGFEVVDSAPSTRPSADGNTVEDTRLFMRLS